MWGIIDKIRGLFGSKDAENDGLKILAPLTGDVIPLEDVPDVVFSERLVGDGVAIKPSSNCIIAPFDGDVKFFDSNHCMVIKHKCGLELLIHFGIDTVELAGEGFTRLVENGQTVKAGDHLIDLDLPYLETNAKSTITPVVISNAPQCGVKNVYYFEGKATAGFTNIMSVVLEDPDAGNA